VTRDTCHAPGCAEPAPAGKAFCRRHWNRLPRALRRRCQDVSAPLRSAPDFDTPEQHAAWLETYFACAERLAQKGGAP
jgi:hypothetical protein